MKKTCIIAVSNNSWGRGNTVEAAIQQLVKAGGKHKDCRLRFILGDDKAYVNDLGTLMVADETVESYKISAA